MKPITAFAAGLFTLAGVNHFVNPSFYLKIMPPWLPAHEAMNYASGAAEAAGGIGLAFPQTRRVAGWWLIATMVAVFPANVHMALHPEDFKGIPGGRAALLARLPVQGLFIWLIAAAMRDDR